MKKGSFLFGRTYFSIAKEDVERLINLCNAMQISFGEITLCEDVATFYVALFQEFFQIIPNNLAKARLSVRIYNKRVHL